MRTITLQKIVPLPLADRLAHRSSEIWNNSITLYEGEWIKIKSPSGFGKTTLIHIVYKLRSDFGGKILYDERCTDDISIEEFATLRQKFISIIFQDLRLFPQLTALENIQLKNILGGLLYSEKEVLAMADYLQIKHVLYNKAQTLSYGEQQRVAIIRALVQPFTWLIMDEPFSHLDQHNIKLAAQLIAEECKKRKAGFLLTDLDDDNHFSYTKQLNL